jgi:hypothetical protein
VSAAIGLAVIAVVWLAVYAVVARPWYTWLHLAELPGALLALLSGRQGRRRLYFLLKARRAATQEVTAAQPPGELGIVIALRWMAARLTASPFGPVPARPRGQRLPAPPACPEHQDAGAEAVRARAEHDRYEREFAASMPPGTITARLLPPGTLTYHPGLPPGAAYLSAAGYVIVEEWPEFYDDPGRFL